MLTYATTQLVAVPVKISATDIIVPTKRFIHHG
jgi:hypothetical protein